MHVKLLSALLACLLSAAGVACSRSTSSTGGADAGTGVSYTTRGVVRSVDPGKKTITIAHEDIPGFMKAMTMPFDLRDASLARGLAAGDKVKFSFTDEGHGRLVVQTIEKTP